jgi:hypothetical protein
VGSLSIARGIIGGVAGAAGDQQTQQEMVTANQQEAVRKQNEMKGKIAPFLLNIKSLQGRLATAQPNSPEYNQIADDLQHNVHSVREVFHPDWKPGPTEWLKTHTTDRMHITNADQRNREVLAKQQKTAGEENKVAGSLVDSAPQSPFTAWSAQYKQATGHPPTPEESQQFAEKQGGILSTQKPNLKNFKGPNGEIAALDANKPEQIPAGWTIAGNEHETSDTRARGDFDTFKQKNPEYKGSFEQWKTEQSAVGRASQNRDDKYIAIQQKRSSGQPITPDEKAYQAGYDLWIKKKLTDPGVARAAAFSANRYVPIIDPSDPQKVVLMKAGEAAKAGAGTPQSISFKTDQAMTNYMTSGKGGQNLATFHTSIDHLRLLQEASKALQNGDIQALNRFSNAWKTATGEPGPTNFNSVKAAVAGEIAKTFSSATIPEQEAISSTINAAENDQQIAGAVDYYTQLMQGKVDALQEQFTQGQQGKPAFDKPTGPKTKQLQDSRPSQRKVGETKKFPNGKTGVWDGQGWVAQ